MSATGRRIPAISVGMPTYNGERFLARAIESVLAQTLTDFELVISDNASTDSTQEICERYAAADPRIRYIRHAENRGAWFNFPFVLEQARAPLFCWAADDDERNPRFLELLSTRMRAGVALAFGTVELIGSGGEVLRHYPPLRYDSGLLRRSVRYFMDPEDQGKACLIYGLFPTALLREFPVIPYRNSAYGFDMHFVFDILQEGPAAFEPDALFRCRLYDNKRPHEGVSAEASTFDSLATRLCHLADRVLLLRAIRYYATYPRIARNRLGSTALVLLLPMKYARSLIRNGVLIAKAALYALRRR